MRPVDLRWRPGPGLGSGPSALGTARVCDAGPVSAEVPEFPPEPWRAATVPPAPPEGDLSFTCPRCRGAVQERTYGPCASCRADMRATVGGDRREVARADYEPKVNVTPNAVALKE